MLSWRNCLEIDWIMKFWISLSSHFIVVFAINWMLGIRIVTNVENRLCKYSIWIFRLFGNVHLNEWMMPWYAYLIYKVVEWKIDWLLNYYLTVHVNCVWLNKDVDFHMNFLSNLQLIQSDKHCIWAFTWWSDKRE